MHQPNISCNIPHSTRLVGLWLGCDIFDLHLHGACVVNTSYTKIAFKHTVL
jgi:hypothetical protein